MCTIVLYTVVVVVTLAQTLMPSAARPEDRSSSEGFNGGPMQERATDSNNFSISGAQRVNPWLQKLYRGFCAHKFSA